MGSGGWVMGGMVSGGWVGGRLTGSVTGSVSGRGGRSAVFRVTVSVTEPSSPSQVRVSSTVLPVRGMLSASRVSSVQLRVSFTMSCTGSATALTEPSPSRKGVRQVPPRARVL